LAPLASLAKRSIARSSRHANLPAMCPRSAVSAIGQSVFWFPAGGSGILRLCAPVTGSLSSQGCDEAWGSCPATRAPMKLRTDPHQVCHESGLVSRVAARSPTSPFHQRQLRIRVQVFRGFGGMRATIFVTSSAGVTASALTHASGDIFHVLRHEAGESRTTSEISPLHRRESRPISDRP